MENNVPVLMYKLEQIFPASFFDSMEHLWVRLPYETRLGGPVQYHWMYHFERYKVSNNLYTIVLYSHFLKKKYLFILILGFYTP